MCCSLSSAQQRIVGGHLALLGEIDEAVDTGVQQLLHAFGGLGARHRPRVFTGEQLPWADPIAVRDRHRGDADSERIGTHGSNDKGCSRHKPACRAVRPPIFLSIWKMPRPTLTWARLPPILQDRPTRGLSSMQKPAEKAMTSASGYDLRPLSKAEREPLAALADAGRAPCHSGSRHRAAVLRHAARTTSNRASTPAACAACRCSRPMPSSNPAPAGRASISRSIREHITELRDTQPRHDPHRDPLPPLRWAPRARVSRRPAADPSALLPELGLDAVLSGRSAAGTAHGRVSGRPGLAAPAQTSPS